MDEIWVDLGRCVSDKSDVVGGERGGKRIRCVGWLRRDRGRGRGRSISKWRERGGGERVGEWSE